MSNLIQRDEYGMFIDKKFQTRVDSLFVANYFSKRHGNVLRDIKCLDCSKEFSRLNFKFISYVDKKEKHKEICEMTRDGFTFLVMGYKGKKVSKFKEQYIKRFNEMEKEAGERQKLTPIHLDTRRTLTDAIQELPDSTHKCFKYKQYTDLIYKIVLGKTASQMRKDLGIGRRDTINHFLAAENIRDIITLEGRAAELLIMGFSYEQIKAGLSKLYSRIKLLESQAEQFKFIGV